MKKLDIKTTAHRLCAYTGKEAGVAVLAHTDAGTIDLFLDGLHYGNVLAGRTTTGGPIVKLRSRKANYYETFDLIGPIPPEFLEEMGDQYTQLIQARLEPEQMDELLTREGF